MNIPRFPSRTEDADLSRSEYVNVNLAGAHFIDVNLQRTRIINANLTGSLFEDVAIRDVIIRNADLTNLTIEDACYTGMRIEGIPVLELLRAYRERK